MRNAIVLFAFLFSSADALAQDPLDTALRDPRRPAGCMQALDAACVIALGEPKSYLLPSATGFDFAKAQTRYYAFVPYVSRSNFGGQVRTQQAFEVALSADLGATWMFVDGTRLTPARMRLIIPSYSGQPLPPADGVDPTDLQ